MLLVWLALAACDESDGPSVADGELYGHCTASGTCNAGLSCSSSNQLCLPIDAGIVTIDAPLPDAGPFVCANDQSLEPNDTYSSAWITPVDSNKNLTLSSLALCPSGERDHYAVSISVAQENLEVLVEYSPQGMAPFAAILNSGGVALANATMIATNTQRVYIPSLPTGTYYVQVAAPTPTTTLPDTRNNYTLTINVTGP